MNILNEFEFRADTELGMVNVYVTESKTNWYVTIRPFGWELPVAVDWKMPKNGIDSRNEWEAFNLVFDAWRKNNKNLKRF